MSDNPVKSILKTFGILDILIFEDLERKGYGLVELSKKTDIKPNTIHNILKSMIKCGYVLQNKDGKYVAGEKCKKVGLVNKFMSQNCIDRLIFPKLNELHNKLLENVAFSVLSNGKRYQIISLEAERAVKAIPENPGNRIYNLVTGISLAANADEKELVQIVENYGYPDGIDNMGELKKFLAQEREKDVFILFQNRNELETFGVPVELNDGETKIICSVGVYMPSYRCNDEVRKKVIDELKSCKEFIEKNWEA